jgi:molybdate transport system substrate-binding protein
MNVGSPSGGSARLSTSPLSKLSAALSTSFLLTFPLLSLLNAYPPPNTELLVATAADLAAVQDPLSQAFERAAGQKVRFTIGASGMLARQIDQGAPYDLFLSANESFVTDLVKAGRLVPDSVRVYAYGRLGLWSRNGSVKTLAQLTDPAILHVSIANPAHAPYGAAAREMFERLGLWKQLEQKIVYGENVRQALQFAESGNADAVVTAWSLVYDRGGILLSDSTHKPIRQAGGVVSGRPGQAAARRFLDFLGSAEGRKILTDHGFSVPPAK